MWWKWIGTIVKKDWTEHGKMFVFFFGGMMLIALLPSNILDDKSRQQAMGGALLGIGYAYAYYVFTCERMFHTLPMLLGLPVRPMGILIGKFVSLYSFCLATVELPALLLQDSRFFYMFNAEVLCIATACMTCSVFFEYQGASMVPLLLIPLAFMRQGSWEAFQPYEFKAATAAFVLVPVLILVCILQFRKDTAV